MHVKNRIRLILCLALAAVLLFCACGTVYEPEKEEKKANESATVAVEMQPVAESEHKTVNVSNIDEFLAAIAPNTEIILAPGTYNITAAKNYGKFGTNACYSWVDYGYSNEYELRISNTDDLTFRGGEIVTDPRAVHVLAFDNCDNLSLCGLSVGHTEAAEACEGSVVWLTDCNGATIDSCSLYGCGTTGVFASGSDSLSVLNTDIYHCSSEGIYFYDGKKLSVDNCRIYDCGASEIYGNAMSAISFYDANHIKISDCEVYSNYAYSFLGGYNLSDTIIENINIHDNHFSSMFDCSGDIIFSNLSLQNNTIDKWTSEYSDSRISMDGKFMGKSELDELWADQLSSAGMGETEVEYKEIDYSGTKEVHVETADEFIAAIASNTVIYIDVPQIILTEASDYGDGASEDAWIPDFGDKNYTWLYEYDGPQLCIGNVSNFHICGGEITAEPRYANVLSFYGCSGISLENVHLGHNPEPGSCCGGVLYLQCCDDILLDGCDLYGCGILGIMTETVKSLQVQNTVIHDCSYGAAQLYDTDGASFFNCEIIRCPDPHFELQNCTGFSWNGKLMDPFSSFSVND